MGGIIGEFDRDLKLRTRNRTPWSLPDWARLAALEVVLAAAGTLALGVLVDGHFEMHIDARTIQIAIEEKRIQIVTANDETPQPDGHAHHRFAHLIQRDG